MSYFPDQEDKEMNLVEDEYIYAVEKVVDEWWKGTKEGGGDDAHFPKAQQPASNTKPSLPVAKNRYLGGTWT